MTDIRVRVAGAEQRIARAERDIAEAAAALAAARFPQVTLSAADWARVVSGALSGTHDYPQAQAVQSRRLLGWACDRLPAASREPLIVAVGAIAKTAQLRWVLAPSDDERDEDPLRLVRGARQACIRIQAGREPAPTEEVELTPLAMWALGLIDARTSELDLLGAKEFGRDQMKRLARQSAWPAMLDAPRHADLRRLSAPSPRLRSAVETLLSSMGDDPMAVIRIAALRLPPTTRSLDAAVRLLAEFAVDDPGEAWRELDDLGPQGAEVMRRLAEISADRGDLLVVHDRFVVIESQGFLDALLTYVVGETADTRNKKWHELEVHRAAKKAWPGALQVLAGVSWRDAPAAAEDPPIAGEIDTLVRDGGLFIDIQAKSARSAEWTSRERLPVTDALAQHERLHERADAEIELLRDGRETRDSRRLRVDLRAHTIVPITVGTDVVQRFHVGGSGASGGRARVLTTLDHLRIVNDFVPAPLRPVYWLDRYAQELATLRFVDEIDFLAAWWRAVMTEPDAATLRFLRRGAADGERMRDDLVLATDSDIERVISVSNTAALAGGTIPAVTTLLVEARAPIARATTRVAPILALLAEPGIRRSELYWPFARMLAGNQPDHVADALAAAAPLVLRGGTAPVGVSPRHLAPDEVPLFRRQGVRIVVVRDGRARRLVNVGEEPPELIGPPRFDPAAALAR